MSVHRFQLALCNFLLLSLAVESAPALPLLSWQLGEQEEALELFRRDGDDGFSDIGTSPTHDYVDYEAELMCSGIENYNYTSRCHFIRHTADCQDIDGFINYLEFEYCAFPNNEALSTVAVIILALILLYLFLILGTIAASFFCPSLDAIAKSLNLSDNVAGVTFLAFGNGAPDIFACIAAVTGGHGADNGLRLVVGELFGGGMFVTSVVVFAVAMVASPFRLAEVPFMRDVIFYLGAAFWTFWIVWDGRVTLYEGLGYIVLYGIFVIVVLIGHKITQYRERRELRAHPGSDIGDVFVLTDSQKARIESAEQKDSTEKGASNQGTEGPTGYGTLAVEGKDLTHKDSEPLVGTLQPVGIRGHLMSLCLALIPIDWKEWPEQSLVQKILNVLKIPVMFLGILTIPLVDHDKDLEKRNWNRILNSLHMITAPMFAILVTRVALNPVSGNFLAWHLTLIIGTVFAILVFVTSKYERPPIYHTAFAYAGFAMGIIWIYTAANEIINVLQALGIMFNLSEELLGLLLLAIGNSIADLVTDTANAKAGRPVMSIGACFGGPLFNMLLGFGLSCTIGTIASGEDLEIEYQPTQSILFAGLTISLLSSLIVMLITWFKVTKVYGSYLFFLYITFVLVIILVETDVIDFNNFTST
ncbi:mitochondrial sodium/calcium exchanger protein-like [Ptychodera flava]|uniref:mitochondrial sodium/calcium exchanger protein-like n=1 Tax=Ptychodera flava TaxID=63121 RepID=UPI003969DCAA